MENENLIILDMVAHQKISVNEAVALIELINQEASEYRMFCADEPLTIEVSLN